MKHFKSGMKKSELHRKESSVLEKKIISGNMVQVLVVLVLKSIMTEGKNTVVENQDVQ